MAQVEKCLAGQVEIPSLDGIIAKQVTLPKALESLWRRNAYEMDFDLVTAYRKQRTIEYVPGEFERGKFPDYSDEEIQRLVGLPVEKLGWNLWSVRKAPSRNSSAASVAA